MKKSTHIFLETILILSSVFIFRSLWTLMDRIPLLNNTYVHIILFIVGFVLLIYSIQKLTHAD